VGIERHEVLPIVAALHHLRLPRPPTLHVLLDTLVLHDITLAAIQLDDLRPSPIYLFTATLRWWDAGGRDWEQQRDLRPGDAIGLALLTGCPLLLADELAQRLGVTLTEGQTAETSLLDDLLRREGLVLRAEERLVWALARPRCAMPSSPSCGSTSPRRPLRCRRRIRRGASGTSWPS
jgi:bifunctional DNase/RNase